MKNTSRTDWKRLAEMKDEDIDTSDIPELDEVFFRNAETVIPPQPPATPYLNADALNWFKAKNRVY